MLAAYIKTKSLRILAELYEMKKDKVHKIIQRVNINFEPQKITDEKLKLFIILDGFWIRNNHKSYKEIQKYANKDNLKQKDKREIHSVTLFIHSEQIGNSKKYEIKNKFSYWLDEKISLE